MSAHSEVKVRLDPATKRQFDQVCREAGTTMSSEISHLVKAAIERNAEAVAQLEEAPPEVEEGPAEEIVIETVTPEPTPTDHLIGQFNALLAWLEKLQQDRPQSWFDQWFKARATPEFATLAKPLAEQGKRGEDAGIALAAIQKQLDDLVRIARRVPPRFYQDYRFWTAFGAGFSAFLLLLALLPGETAPSRFVARKIIGGKNDVHAAGIMAGGNGFTGQLIFETSALMKSEPFAKDYARCIERAKAARKVTRCTLTFPALVQ